MLFFRSFLRIRVAAPALVAVAAGLGGCAPTVRLPEPNVALPAEFESPPVSARTGNDAAHALPELTLDRWWPAFADPQLDALIDSALAQSTTARLAVATLAQARANRALARAGTLPSGNLTVSETEQGTQRVWGEGVTSGGAASLQAGFFPAWEVDLFGRLSAIRTQADVRYAGSTLDYHGARLALAADVAASLFQARGTAVSLDLARQRLKIASELAANARRAEALGLSSAQDFARVAADAATAQAEVTRLEGELQAAKRSLLILTGRPDAPTASLPIAPVLNEAPAIPAVTPGILLARRPDVLAADMNLVASALQVRVNRLALFPRFQITPGLSLTGSGGQGGTVAGTGVWSIGAGLALPILDRPRLMAQLRVSQAQGEQAVVQYERAVQTAYGEAENALTRLSADRGRIGSLEEAEQRSARAFELAGRGYRAGLTDLTTYLQTEQAWLSARSARDQARLALLTGTVDVVRALGGGWDAGPVAAALAPYQTQELPR